MAKTIRPHVYHTKNAGTRDGRKGTTPVDNLRPAGWGDKPKAEEFDEGYAAGAKVAAEMDLPGYARFLGMDPQELTEIRAKNPEYFQYLLDEIDRKAGTYDFQGRNALAVGENQTLLAQLGDAALTLPGQAIGGRAGTALGWLGQGGGLGTALGGGYLSRRAATASPTASRNQAVAATPEDRQAAYRQVRGETSVPGELGKAALNQVSQLNSGFKQLPIIQGMTGAIQGGAAGGNLYRSFAGDENAVMDGTAVQPSDIGFNKETAANVGGAGMLGAAGYGLEKFNSRQIGAAAANPQVAKTWYGRLGQSVRDTVAPAFKNTPQGVQRISNFLPRMGTAASAASRLGRVGATIASLNSGRLGAAAGAAARVLGSASLLAGAGGALADAHSGQTNYDIRQRTAEQLLNGRDTTGNALGKAFGAGLSLDPNEAIKQYYTGKALNTDGSGHGTADQFSRAARTDAAETLVANGQQGVYDQAMAWAESQFPGVDPAVHQHIAQSVTNRWTNQSVRQGHNLAQGGSGINTAYDPNRKTMFNARVDNRQWKATNPGSQAALNANLKRLGYEMGGAQVWSPQAGFNDQAMKQVLPHLEKSGFKPFVPQNTPHLTQVTGSGQR